MQGHALSSIHQLASLMGALDNSMLRPIVRKLVVPFCDEHFGEVLEYLSSMSAYGPPDTPMVTMMIMGFKVVRVKAILAPSITCFICESKGGIDSAER